LLEGLAVNVTEAVKTRISVRSFLDTPISEQTLREVLDVARWSPSGGNLQPWHVYALSGQAMERFKAEIKAEAAENPLGDPIEFPMYPEKLEEPYRTRRFRCGEALYATINIPRENKEARLAQLAKNFEFFGAPAAFFFAIDRSMSFGQWAHLGMFMQTIALVAQERGLGTCMQEFWMLRHKRIRSFFSVPDKQQVYCGMAIGYPNRAHPINSLRTERAAVDEFASFQS
jgi:nitroreductase